MATLRAGPPDGDAHRTDQSAARRPALLVALVAVLAVVVLATPTQAADEDLHVPEDYRDVIEGDSVPIRVTFGTLSDDENDEKDVKVSCDGCPIWVRTVQFDDQKANCRTTDAYVNRSSGEAKKSEAVCRISFPEGFRHQGGGPPPAEVGEPSRATTYRVWMGIDGEEARATFQAHLSSASTCRPIEGSRSTGVGQRTDILMLSSSGHPKGEEVTLKIISNQEVLFQRSWTSAGEAIAYHYRWQVPRDIPIDSGGRQAKLIVDAASGGETEQISLRPAVAQPFVVRQPGLFGQATEFNRTEDVRVWTEFQYLSAPRGCKDMSWKRDLQPVTSEAVGDDPPRVLVRRLSSQPTAPAVETVDTVQTTFRNQLFLVNYTIPKDERTTDEQEEDPVYDIKFERTRLEDGNYISAFNASDYEVYPYTIKPEFEVLQDDVERLETAKIVVNLTYADGSPFTPNDTDEQLEIAFGPEGEDPKFEFEADHRRAGLWNVSKDLGFQYEPLGYYTWRIAETRDENGAPGEENRVPATVTDVVDVLSARPRLNLTAIVDGEPVEGTERTQRVNVRVKAEFRNGKPLTADEIDPSMGGIELRVDKRNKFGRVVDQDRYVMAHAGDPGTWIESFRIGRDPSTAPAGTWDLTFVARDDEEPPNENVTSLPFQVDPANLTAADTEAPPPLVNGTEVAYQFRLHYPDGTLASERLFDESRGGDLNVRLERVTRAGEPAIVERELEPRPVSGGQAWRVEMNASKIVPGNHFFNVTGQDVHGNPIPGQPSNLFTVLFNGEFRNSTTPICPDDSQTQGCAIQRGETVYVVFPGASGDKGMDGDRPKIRVHRKDPGSGRWQLFRSDVWLSPQQFFNLTGRDVGNNHVGRFTTDRSTPTDTYRLVILGRAKDDTGFAGVSQTFNVTRVPVDREVIQPLPDQVKKTQEIAARIEHKAGDVIDTTIVEVGPVRARNVETDTTGVGTFLRWQPPSTFPTGPASIHVEGRDLFGNPFEVDLGPVQLQPVEIRTKQQGSIGETARRGELFSFDLQMTYETGASFDSSDGNPKVVVVDEQGNEVDTGQAKSRVDGWEIRWRPRADLPAGEYQVVVTGTDSAGNVVNDFETPPIRVTAGTVTGEASTEPPDNVQRGDLVQAQLDFPTAIAEGNATVTTGTDEVGEPQTTIDGSTVKLSFPTDRKTELVDARFRFTGTDIFGNNITAETERFSVRAQEMQIKWVQQPPTEVTNDEPVKAAFVVEYPDGTPMRPGEGAPIVGLFAVEQPLGQIEAKPLEENPVVWQVSWDPPDDARTDIPYHFSASARDSFRNEAPPVASRGFFVQNPVVPDYVPAPAPGLEAMLAVLAGLAVVLGRRRQN